MSTKILNEEIYFNGGLDTDSDYKFVKQGDYVDALNISKLYDGDGGVVKNANGNAEKVNSFLPTGTNKCIGWCADDENDAIIFFNYNSNNNHGIYRYNSTSETFDKILHEESILAFKSDCRNLQAHVIGDLLYWNEGKDSSGEYIQVPRKINLTKAYNYTNESSLSVSGVLDAYSEISVYTLSVIKPPYLGYLNAIFTTDFDYTGTDNFISNNYYKFAIQLVYDDNEVSVLGNYSNAALYRNDNHNCLALRFYYDSFSGTVSKIRIFSQENFLGTPYMVAEIDVDDFDNVYENSDNQEATNLIDGNYYVYRWYGQGTNQTYSGSSQIYDTVPLYANSFTIADNRLMYGNCILYEDVSEGGLDFSVLSATNASIYDAAAFTVNFGAEASGAAYTVNIGYVVDNFLTNANSTHFADIFLWSSREVVAGTYFGMDLKIECEGICPYWSQSKIVDYVIDNSRVYGIRRSDSVTIDGVLSSYTIGNDVYLMAYLAGCDSNVSGGNDYSNTLAYSKANRLTYKSGSRRLFGVAYFDTFGRTVGYVVGDGSTQYVPRKNGNSDSGIFGFTTNINPTSSDVAYVSVAVSDNLDWISVTWVSSVTYTGTPDYKIAMPPNYTYVEGDVVRLSKDGNVWKIIDADASFLYFGQDIDYVSGSIEILTPRSIGDPLVFHEVKTYKTGSISAEYGVAAGDVIISDGDIAGEIPGLTSSSRYNNEDFVDVYGNSIFWSGRPLPEQQEFSQSEFRYIYFGSKYFDNTNINGLSTFISTNRVELSDSDGDIVALKQIGEVLHAYQRREVTSFYLGKTILKQSSTGEVTADTSQVLGGKRESAFDYGTIFQVARMDNYTFGYDIYKGVFWMNGYNGIQVISGKQSTSNYMMDTYFKNKSRDLLDSGVANVDVKIGVDKANELIFVTFIDSADSSNNDTIAYHLPSNRWISRCSFVPETYAWSDNVFYSLSSGKLYAHDDPDADKNTFYGTYYNSYIQFISHAAPNQVKVFNAIGVHSDNEWKVDPIEIDATDSHPNGMYTKILPTEFIKEEGVYKAYIPKNMKTRTSTATNYDRITGDDMRGYVMKIKMTNDDTTKTELFKVDINSELSR